LVNKIQLKHFLAQEDWTLGREDPLYVTWLYHFNLTTFKKKDRRD